MAGDPQAPVGTARKAGNPAAGLSDDHQGRSCARLRAFFGDLTSRDREQVWGATLPTDARVERRRRSHASCAALLSRLESRLSQRMAEDAGLSRRAEMFRFPAQMEQLEAPLEGAGRNRLRRKPLRGERPGCAASTLPLPRRKARPIDRMVGDMAASSGLRAEPPPRRAAGEQRSYLPARPADRGRSSPRPAWASSTAPPKSAGVWIWRGSVAAAAVAVIAVGADLPVSPTSTSPARLPIRRVSSADLSQRLANVAARQAPTDPLDLDLALEAMAEIENARSPVEASIADPRRAIGRDRPEPRPEDRL